MKYFDHCVETKISRKKLRLSLTSTTFDFDESRRRDYLKRKQNFQLSCRFQLAFAQMEMQLNRPNIRDDRLLLTKFDFILVFVGSCTSSYLEMGARKTELIVINSKHLRIFRN